MRKWIYIFIGLLLPLSLAAEEKGGGFDMDEYLYGHVRDSYEWHITTVKGHPVSIPLPVIVASKTGNGFHIFSSKHLEHGEYEGFYIAPAGSKYENKIVERAADGSEIRPWDFSITKNVFGLMINCALLLFIVLGTAKWYRKHDAREEAPKGGVGLMEMLVTMIEDDVIKSCVGEDYKRYSPYLLTAFFFIFINNLMGIVPFFPGGANITGNIAVTLVLALFTFFIVNIFGNKHYWKDILWPEVPTWLKVPLPLMPAIEIIGMFTKPFSLMVRLFANILAGHFMILGVVAVIFLTAWGGPERQPHRGGCASGSVHGLPGTACRLHPGLCVHDAVGCLHRAVAAEAGGDGINRNIQNKQFKIIELCYFLQFCFKLSLWVE